MSGKIRGFRGGNRPAPAMHIHQPHIAQVVSVSANGHSAIARPHVLETEPYVPDYVQEDFVTNAAVESCDFSYDLGDTSLLGEIQEPESDGIVFTSKRKVYENSVCVLRPS
jgi:hypothetical protein